MTSAREVIAASIRDAIQLAQGGYEGQHPADAALEALEAAGFTVARLEQVGSGKYRHMHSHAEPCFRILPEEGTP